MIKTKSRNTSNIHLAYAGNNNKKLILAISLIGVMATMWIRVFVGGPKTISDADAVAVDTRGIQSEQKQDCLKLKYHSLPFVMGRDDILSRDLFSKKPWKDKGGSHGGEPIVCSGEIVSEPDLAAGLSDILESKLKAVLSGNEKEAFIGDKLYNIDDVLRINYQDKCYRLKIVDIEDESVTFINIKMKMKIEIKVER